MKFKDYNKKLSQLSVPIVMNDIKRIAELEEIRDSLEEEMFKEVEIEEYIGLLKEFNDELKYRITNNLKANGFDEQQEIDDILESIIKKSVIIGDPTEVYNCHGWSTGLVKWVGLDNCNSDQFANRLKFELISGNISKCDDFITINSESIIKKVDSEPTKEGSIVSYYNHDGLLTHTAKYLTTVDWYEYDEKLHDDWYKKVADLVSFDSSNQCVVKNYSSKLGLGYLIIHEIDSLTPLYGENTEYYEF